MLDMQASTSVVLKGPLAPTTRAVKCGVTSALLLYPGPGGVMCVEDAGVKVDLQVFFDRRRSRLTTSKNLKVGIHLIPAELDRVLVPDKAWPTAASGQSVSLGFCLEARGIEYSAPESPRAGLTRSPRWRLLEQAIVLLVHQSQARARIPAHHRTPPARSRASAESADSSGAAPEAGQG
ncbi:hypothetical protein WJX72_002345 [[Myrmecia] bisecta]|uniref:Uncharacterized protein n=1 Tax=[Myrmecia] bisecta TaxID=41462 RepID=A0AAW1Q411_9CHLO